MSRALTVTPLAPFCEVLLIQAKVFGDERGFFLESFNRKHFQEATGLDVEFVQDNHSRSDRGVLRGIHFQREPHAQGKLVRVAKGAVWDVAVDLRRSSPTYQQWAGRELNDRNGEMLWIPPGFGHGFVVLEDGTDFLYKTTDYYHPECESSVAWNDPALGIQWPIQEGLKLSARDANAPSLLSADH
jgi:dTDP-4-dehydrorhamnose 3,5-epimerase